MTEIACVRSYFISNMTKLLDTRHNYLDVQHNYLDTQHKHFVLSMKASMNSPTL